MSIFFSNDAAHMTYARFNLDRSTPMLWRVTFDNPPITRVDSVMIDELGDPFVAVGRNEEPAVLVFDSADPNHVLGHSSKEESNT